MHRNFDNAQTLREMHQNLVQLPFELFPMVRIRNYYKLENKMSEEEQKQSYGQKAVGLSFNPSNDDKVNVIKSAYASLIDLLDNFRNSSTIPEQKRLASVAITEAQTAQMWAVKAVTWQE